MSVSPDGRRSLGSDKVHIESIHPEVVFPMPPDLTVLIDDTVPPQVAIASPIPLPVSAVPYELAVPQGLISGVSEIKVAGRNFDIDSGSSPEDVWEGGGIWMEPTTDRIHDIVSDNAADAAAGTGAQSILVSGLSTGVLTTETIVTNGLTNVPTVNAYNPIHELRVLTAGSIGANVGTITATAQTDLTITAIVLPLQNKSQMAIFKVPSDKTAYMTRLRSSFVRKSAQDYAGTELLVKRPGEVWVVENPIGLQIAGQSGIDERFNPYIMYPSSTLIKVQANVTANNCEVYAGFQLYLVDN